MREFKFRAWHTESKSMTVFDLEKASKDQYIASHVCALLSNTHIDGKGLMMQFTGLLDKNGAEIYEGDIIKTTALFNDCNQKGAIDYFTVISFMGNYCLARHGSEAGSPMYPACLKSSIEVIGNIYENKELLGGRRQ